MAFTFNRGARKSPDNTVHLYRPTNTTFVFTKERHVHLVRPYQKNNKQTNKNLCWFHLRMSDKAVKTIHFTENWSWTKYLFDVTGDVILYTVTVLSAGAAVWGYAREKNMYVCLPRSPARHCFHGVLLLIERITDKSRSFKCGPLADYFLEMNEVKRLLQGKADSVLSQ